MTEFSKRDLANRSFLGGVLLLLCALTFYYFAVLRIDYKRTSLPDLGPYPDATEYFAQAKALSKGKWPSIQIGYDTLPSRYPPGYPALMLPWLKILAKTNSFLAPFRTNQTIGLLLLLIVFTFYAYLAMPLTGGFATLLLATFPGFFTFCRSSLSEISASALIALAFIFAYLGLTTERRWRIYVSAACLGLSLNFRIQALFFAPLLLAMCCFPVREMRQRWLIHCAAVSVLFVLAASPVLVLNMIQFHSPLKTGYAFWTPHRSRLPPFFSVRYVPRNLARLWSEFGLRPTGYSAGNIFGTGTSFVPAFLLLTCLGLFFVRKSAFVLCALLSILSFLASTFVFVYPDLRFYLPVFVLSIAVAVLPMNWAAKNFLVPRRAVAAIAIFVLFAASCLGYPSRSGYNMPGIDHFQAWDALHFSTERQAPKWLIAQHRFLKAFGTQPGVVLSDIDPVYLNAFFPDWIVAAPFDEKHHYGSSQIWRYARPQALALVKRGLDERHSVYALFVSQKDIEKNKARLPVLDGYEWAPVETSTRDLMVLKLSPNNG